MRSRLRKSPTSTTCVCRPRRMSVVVEMMMQRQPGLNLPAATFPHFLFSLAKLAYRLSCVGPLVAVQCATRTHAPHYQNARRRTTSHPFVLCLPLSGNNTRDFLRRLSAQTRDVNCGSLLSNHFTLFRRPAVWTACGKREKKKKKQTDGNGVQC